MLSITTNTSRQNDKRELSLELKKIFIWVFLLLILQIILTISLPNNVYAQNDFSIVEVRRNIPLSDQEAIFKDFYINAGAEAGIKNGMIIPVQRKVSVRDSRGREDWGELIVPVGQIKIISAQNKISVARELKLFSKENEPLLEHVGLMIGDLLDLKGASKK